MNYLCGNLLNLISNNWEVNVILTVRLKVRIQKLVITNKEIKDDMLILTSKFINGLKKLDISCCTDITGKCLDNFSETLEILDCQGCKLLNEKYLKKLTKLKKLDVSYTYITGRYLSKTLESLECESCDYLNEIYLENLTNLKTLNVAYTEITCSCFSETLESLDCRSCAHLEDIYLKNLINLKILDVSQTKITGRWFNNFSNLEELICVNCKHLDEINLTKLTKLGILDVSCTNITGSCFSNFNELLYLKCHNCNHLNSEYFKGTNFHKLKGLVSNILLIS